MKKIWCVVISLLLAVSCFGCAQQTPAGEAAAEGASTGATAGQEPLKVALCVTALVNDGGWCQLAYDGLVKAQELYGIEFAYAENCTVVDMEAILTEYASQGYDLIIGHGFQFGDPALAVAKKYPNVKFAIIEGSVGADNVASYNIGSHEIGYALGMLGAGLTKTGKIGAVMGIQGPSLVKVAEAYKLGARSINPDIVVEVTYTGSFEDAAASKEATLAMADNGVDVVMCGCNAAGSGIIKGCEERGILCFGEAGDMNAMAPDIVVTSAMLDVEALITQTVADLENGTFEGGYRVIGLADNSDIAKLAPYHSFETVIPDELKQNVEDTLGKIKSGELSIPIIETPTYD